MRLFTAMLWLGLTAPAFADDAKLVEKPAETKPAKLGLRVVRVMPESHQALLFDKNRGTHVLAELGQTIGGFVVQEIDDDEVTLSADGASMVLTAPDQRWRRQLSGGDVASPGTAAVGVPAPSMPSMPSMPSVAAVPSLPASSLPAPSLPAPSVAAPVDPYDDAVRSVSAPRVIDAGEGGVRVATPMGATVAAPSPPPIVSSGLSIAPDVAVAVAPDVAVAVAVAPSEAVAVAIPPSELTVTLVRAEVSVALQDFGKLSSGARGAFTPEGLRLDKLQESSLYFKAGLRAGDVVTSVDGKALHSIDDAADLYARSGGLKAATVQVIRASKPLTLRVAIQ